MIHIAAFIALGCFWGLSVPLYKLMGLDGVPVSHIIVYTGFGVGLALALIGKLKSGSFAMSAAVVAYAAGCAVLLNMPFAFSLELARHVPAAEYALIVSTAPLFNFIASWAGGRAEATSQRLLAVGLGFVSSAMLIVSRHGGIADSETSWWSIAAFAVPVMYTAYNWFAARYWPKDADIFAIGAAESVLSALVALPFLLMFDPPWASGAPGPGAYLFVVIACLLWIVERIAFFTLIRDKGALYTIQAVYVATPASVVFAFLIFGGVGDRWIWASLALLMLALWLNNRAKVPPPAGA